MHFRITAIAIVLTLMACGSSDHKDDLSDVMNEDASPETAADIQTDSDVEVIEDSSNDDADVTPGDELDTAEPDADVDDTVQPGHDEPPLVRWVDPFIGTGGALGNVGNTLPGATAPLGLVKVSPDTRDRYGAPAFQHCAGYRYEDEYIYAFSHTHLHGTGVPDYGNIRVMPVNIMNDDMTSRFGAKSTFSHDDEVATAGYYAVTLDNPSVRVEMTATTRCAHHRYTFLGEGSTNTIILDPAATLDDGISRGGAVTIDEDKVEGWNWVHGAFSGRFDGFPLYFSMQFLQKPIASGTWLNRVLAPGSNEVSTDEHKANYGAWFEFDTSASPVVEFKVCLSTVSIEGSKGNMADEMPDWDFEGIKAQTQDAWEREMALFETVGGTAEEKINFYTAVYHTLQMPTIWSDVDGQFQGFKNTVGQADGTYYTDMSFWDTFRTQHPLLTLVWPERQRDMMRSMVWMVEMGGYVPKWPMAAGDTGSMIGQHSASVAADTWIKGVRDFDMDKLYPALQETADGPLPPGSYGGRDGIAAYLELGYVPADVRDTSVSKTLEYAFNDYCMAQLAKELGHNEDYDRYMERSGYYVNVWDSETGFFRGRNADGSWIERFEPEEFNFSGGEYTEGSAWQWLWFVPHDESGLRELFGGDAPFLERLSFFFDKFAETFNFELPGSYYFHGNEPDLHAPYLFIRAGRPDLTQKWVRHILDTNYKPTFDGLVGNDDAGTLAAWYVFSAIGLYPWPCFPGYYITTPIFDEVTVHLPGGDLKIEAQGASQGLRYIRSATFNGQALDELWIEHDKIVDGGLLVLTLDENPHTQINDGPQ